MVLNVTPGIPFLDALDHLRETCPVAAAHHRFQDGCAYVLQGHVNIFADLFAGVDHIYELLTDLIRIGVQETDPAQSIHGNERFQKPGQSVLNPQVLPIAGGVLRHQRYFFDSPGGKLRCLLDQRWDASGFACGPRIFGMMQKAHV